MSYRDRFSRSLQRDEIYLACHSLGRPLDRTAADVQRALDYWYEMMDDAWGPWMAEVEIFRANIARLIGFDHPRWVVPKTSAGQGLRAVLNALMGPNVPTVVATRGEFDSLDFILRTYEAKGFIQLRWVEPTTFEAGVPLIDTAQIIESLPSADLLVISNVFFTTGQLLDVGEVVCEAHRQGVKVLLDTYHSAGVLPIGMSKLDVDFAVGGSYKYTRGGTGACWLAIHPNHGGLRSLDTGWFAKKEPFSYARPNPPEYGPDGDSWMESTPSILPVFQAQAGLEFTLEVGVVEMRQIGLERLGVLRESFKAERVPIFCPQNPEKWGGFALLPHAQSEIVCRTLKTRGVNADARGGNVRFGPDLLTTDDELRRASKIVAEVIA
ncbi:MAG TPA: aminotransferase class V-fold PLP-dependent enzyme [Fimbriimonadaceae bacterium]|nr:aminotransferase class V-fold PLP-dependent enzyme [Fimbriimonadaceae bacterium]